IRAAAATVALAVARRWRRPPKPRTPSRQSRKRGKIEASSEVGESNGASAKAPGHGWGCRLAPALKQLLIRLEFVLVGIRAGFVDLVCLLERRHRRRLVAQLGLNLSLDAEAAEILRIRLGSLRDPF